ncbi:MAG: hypothetical protein RI964_2022 [Pseudomonadota bacterium]|jgi:hypothetical protein
MTHSIRFLALCLIPASVFAHEQEQHSTVAAQPKLTIEAAASTTWNSQTAADSNGLWRIPGALMGGHALPAQKGGKIDDAAVWGSYHPSQRTTLNAGLAVHNDGSASVEVENLSVDHQFNTPKPLSISAGVIEPEFSPTAHHHPSTDTFADANLVADAFWGRSIHDKGVRIAGKPTPNLEVGAEVWNGDFFPAKSGDGAQDVYIKWQHTHQDWDIAAGGWAMQAQATQRSDERYFDGGHTHATATATLPVDVKFTGDTQMAGSWLSVDAPERHGIRPQLRYEAAQTQSNGQLADTTHTAAYKTDHLGFAITPSIRFRDYQLSYRFEKLSLDNHLSGNGAQVLAEETNLINSANPQRQTWQIAGQVRKNWGWRVAYVKDHTLATADQRVNVGLTWQDKLLER